MERIESFASSVKDEAVLLERDEECKRALLSSFIKINGHLSFKDGKEILECHSERASIAKLIYQCLVSLYEVNVRFAYKRSAGFLKRINYLVVVEEKVDEILSDLDIDILSNSLPRKEIRDGEEENASFFAGAFLAAGSTNDPTSSSYHLEIALADEEYTKWLSKALNKVNGGRFHSKVTKRRNQSIVYLKRSDEISDFLILIGAKESCLAFENARIDRDFANQTNRLENFDTANMKKTVATAEKQIGYIHYFEKHGGIEQFHNPKLTALCHLRLKHPDASMLELSEYLSEELASSVSKSNVNHLFRFLKKEYEESKHV